MITGKLDNIISSIHWHQSSAIPNISNINHVIYIILGIDDP